MKARMAFELALNHLKQGKTIARTFWRDKELKLGTAELVVDGKRINSPTIAVEFSPYDEKTICSDGVVGPHRYIYTPVMEDLFANDWYVVD